MVARVEFSLPLHVLGDRRFDGKDITAAVRRRRARPPERSVAELPKKEKLGAKMLDVRDKQDWLCYPSSNTESIKLTIVSVQTHVA